MPIGAVPRVAKWWQNTNKTKRNQNKWEESESCTANEMAIICFSYIACHASHWNKIQSEMNLFNPLCKQNEKKWRTCIQQQPIPKAPHTPSPPALAATTKISANNLLNLIVVFHNFSCQKCFRGECVTFAVAIATFHHWKSQQAERKRHSDKSAEPD